MNGTASGWALALAVVPGVWGYSAFQGAQPARPAQPAQAAATESGDRLVVPWTDPSRSGTLKVSLIGGTITVRGYDGKDVIIESARRDDDEDTRKSKRSSETTSSGLRRISNVSTGLEIEEENNVMEIGTAMPREDVSLIIQVPRRTALELSGVNDGAIVVENIDGDIEANHVNGPVTLTNVSGTVVAHALNDDLKVSLARFSGKPMSFSSMNGDIEVALPADTKATVRLETVQGDILTDFDLTLLPNQVKKTVEDRKGQGGRYRVKLERQMVGTINGGGPELTFKNFNGDITIRKSQ